MPVSENHVIEGGAEYQSALIEGYDLRSIRDVFRLAGKPQDSAAHLYHKKRLQLTVDGGLDVESTGLDLTNIAAMVEETIADTCEEFNLIREDDGLLIGLSGGVDSSALLLALAACRSRLPVHRLVAVTFEDFDSKKSPTFDNAKALASELDVEHHLAPASLADEVFHLKTTLREVLPALMKTEDAHFAMYVDHHTTRRTLEVFAARNDLTSVALGLHTTDLVAGLLNGWMTGYTIADIPVRQIGDARYIYPIAFVPKRELHLYYYQKTGRFAEHSYPNEWEQAPLDRNFYYYFADILQSYWPGLETMLFTAHNMRLRRQEQLQYEECGNCGSSLLYQPLTVSHTEECEVCTILRKHGFINRE